MIMKLHGHKTSLHDDEILANCHEPLSDIAIIISYVIVSRAGHVMYEAPRVCRG